MDKNLAPADAWGRRLPAVRASAVRWPKCVAITGLAGVAPGWACCGCHTYNAIDRGACRVCGHLRCGAAPKIIGFPTYDAWWQAIGRASGIPYRPPMDEALRRVVATGSLIGQPEPQELKDLIAAKDVELASLERGYADFSPTWVQKDSATFIDWTNDWNALKDRYAGAKADAQKNFGVLAPLTVAVGPDWDAVMRAVQQGYPGWAKGVVTRAIPPMNAAESFWLVGDATSAMQKGDLVDLAQRLTAAGGVIPKHGVPQPTKGADTDLNVMNAIEKLPIPGEAGLPWYLWAGVGVFVVGALWIVFAPFVGPTVRIVRADPAPAPPVVKDPDPAPQLPAAP